MTWYDLFVAGISVKTHRLRRIEVLDQGQFVRPFEVKFQKWQRLYLTDQSFKHLNPRELDWKLRTQDPLKDRKGRYYRIELAGIQDAQCMEYIPTATTIDTNNDSSTYIYTTWTTEFWEHFNPEGNHNKVVVEIPNMLGVLIYLRLELIHR